MHICKYIFFDLKDTFKIPINIVSPLSGNELGYWIHNFKSHLVVGVVFQITVHVDKNGVFFLEEKKINKINMNIFFYCKENFNL